MTNFQDPFSLPTYIEKDTALQCPQCDHPFVYGEQHANQPEIACPKCNLTAIPLHFLPPQDIEEMLRVARLKMKIAYKGE